MGGDMIFFIMAFICAIIGGLVFKDYYTYKRDYITLKYEIKPILFTAISMWVFSAILIIAYFIF